MSRVKDEIEMQLEKAGAVLLNGPEGRVIIHRSKVVAVTEVTGANVNASVYYGENDCYNITDSFDTVIEKIYGCPRVICTKPQSPTE